MRNGPRELPRIFGDCYICEELVSSPGNLAVLMVNPDGSIQGLVCGDCLVGGSYVRYVAHALLHLSQGDTPSDDVASGEGSAEAR